MGIGKSIAKQVGPRVPHLAPELTTTFVHEALHRAIVGVGPLKGAAEAAEEQLREQRGDVEKAVHEVIENNVRMAGAQGFLTNIGGLTTMAVMIPANVSGLAVLQIRMVAGIAHLRGYDVHDLRVRNALLALLLGEDTVTSLVKRRKLPAPPMALATAPTHDPHLNQVMAAEVASELLAKVAGKRLATTVARRVPVVGGLVGASADGYSTWQIGRYADREMLSRRPR